LILALCAVFALSFADSVGDRFLHTALTYSTFPITTRDAQSSGWVRAGPCVPGRGLPFIPKNGVSKASPGILYYSESLGYVSGLTIRRWSGPEKSNAGAFWELPKINVTCAAGTCTDITMVFRDPKAVCGNSSEAFAATMPDTGNSIASIGDRLLVGSKLFPVPINSTLAKKAGWSEGNCIPHMGIHYSYVFGGSPQGPWNASSLFPLLPMYDPISGHINAVLIGNPHGSLHVTPVGWWEGPFVNAFMCKNWCSDSRCGFSGTMIWTTMHFYFRDPSTISCNGARCKIFGH